ncbi:hypothetical protein [Pseudomonas savastanoi]|uniref:hypothetical protein n=1 Tax=Pseudomonas savastanoi TaxID=29438 RepID=UPI000EFF97B0|nr:hypothetical protein [Pseudomonas savastanoi]
MKTCKKHIESPVFLYKDCVGCELQELRSERDHARAEIAGLKTGYEAYERVNAELRAECEALQEKYEAARDRKNSITALQAENEALRDAAAVSAMRIKELDLLFGRYILAMRAAVIEDEHGKTETTGMDWIFNSLAGPGQLPPEGETDAQGYFDREIVAVDNGMHEVLAFHDQRRAAKTKDAAMIKEQSHDLNDKNNVQALAAEVARLSAECAELRKDSDRLDWLTAKGEIEEPGQGDVRGFIDSAMSKQAAQ